MRKIVKLLVLGFIFGLSSCNSPLKKSVIEPLEIEDLKKIIEKDTLFEFTYRVIQKIRDLKLTDDVEKAKWSDITYSRVHKIAQLYSDTLVQSKYDKKIKSDWNAKYGMYIPKSDSISDYWEKYKKERSLNNFVGIELFDIQTNSNGYAEVGFKFNIFKVPLDKLSFDYVFIEKGNTEEISDWESYPILNDRNTTVYISEKITNSKIIWKTDYRNQDIIKNKLLEDVLDKYVFKLKLKSISNNGITVYESDINIPTSIERMWESKNKLLYEYYREDVIKEFLTNDFVRYKEFKGTKIDSIAKIIDPKVIEFIKLNVEEIE